MFSFSFRHGIWKVYPMWEAGRLLVELRDEENVRTEFICVDIFSGKEVWQINHMNESWWLGVESIAFGLVVLHTYKNRQNPEHMGVYVYESASGKLLWSNPGIAFSGIDQHYLYALNRSDGEMTAYLSRSGELVKNTTLPKEELKDLNTNKLTYCVQYKEGEPYFAQVSNYVKTICGKEPVGSIEYMETKGCPVISYHIRQGELKLANYLLVTDTEGKILLHEYLGESEKGIATDTCFISNNHLIFVRNKKELSAYEIE